jgi:hypothetical protein
MAEHARPMTHMPVKVPERQGRAIDWSAAVVDGSHIRALQRGLDGAVSG